MVHCGKVIGGATATKHGMARQETSLPIKTVEMGFTLTNQEDANYRHYLA